MKEKIVAQLVEVESLAEGPCTVCGEPLNGLQVLAQAELPDLEKRVCEYCLDSGLPPLRRLSCLTSGPNNSGKRV